MIRGPRIALWSAFFLILCGCTAGRHYHYHENRHVHLYLYVPGAERVLFASSLDNFTPRPARSIGGGGWTVELPAESEFRYFYIVDGAVYLPACRFREKDDFGSENCIYHPRM